MSLDLRTRPRLDRQDLILMRAEWLLPGDRALLEAVFRRGQTIRELSPLLAMPERTLRLRLHRLVDRVLSDRFAYAIRHLARWTGVRRRIATCCILHGLALRAGAKAAGVSIHTARRHLDAIDAMHASSDRHASTARRGREVA